MLRKQRRDNGWGDYSTCKCSNNLAMEELMCLTFKILTLIISHMFPNLNRISIRVSYFGSYPNIFDVNVSTGFKNLFLLLYILLVLPYINFIIDVMHNLRMNALQFNAVSDQNQIKNWKFRFLYYQNRKPNQSNRFQFSVVTNPLDKSSDFVEAVLMLYLFILAID